MYKFKVEILLDEEKIKKDDKYEPQVMYDYIRDMFKRFDLPEVKTGKSYHLIFTDKGRNRDYGAIWNCVWNLYDTDWFKKYASKCMWYNNTNKSVENVLIEAAKYGD